VIAVPAQRYFEDVQEGQEMPVVQKTVTPQQLVKYAGASHDYYEVHYNETFAKEQNLPGLLVHGALKNAFLGQLVLDWIGEWGTLKKLACQYRGMDVVNDTLTCKGRVTKKRVEGEEHIVELEIWVENSKSEKTTPGSAVVTLPSRNQPLVSTW
jgi:acyl dehydratase